MGLKIACIGAGYVGGPTMAVIARQCPEHQVVVLDMNQERINAWQSDHLPIYEPGLLEVVRECRGRTPPNLLYSTDAMKHIGEADVVFVCVNTPTKAHGLGAGKSANLYYWEAASRLIAAACRQPGRTVVVVEKSTVPVKTAQAISKVLAASGAPGVHFEILSNPEFMAEGSAVEDLLNPDRVLIGGREAAEGRAAVQVLVDLYAHWVPRDRILTTTLWSAELSKLACNALLAQRISSINSISALCEETGADIREVSRAIGADSRIGPKFINASLGFGGSCFPKDLLNLVYICETLGLKDVATYFQKVIDMNEWQKSRFLRRIVTSMFGTVTGKKIAILGWAYKKNTGDSRETPSMDIAQGLQREGAKVSVYDVKVSSDQIQMDMIAPRHAWDTPRSPRSSTTSLKVVDVEDNAYASCSGAHALCVCTDWDEFRSLDFKRIYASMVKPAFVFDGRNLLDHEALRALGYVVYALGRPLDKFITEQLNE